MVKSIECRGTPYQIGYTHGSKAAEEVKCSIAFYAGLFLKNSNQSWSQVLEVAKKFDQLIRAKWPRYHEELQGIADGSKSDILDIVALNVRTEIAFGLMKEGCTSLFWETPDHTFLGQNWDWMEEQKSSIIILSIYQDSFPAIKMVSEAGILGKIGFNSAGVGVCFNAIRVRGLDDTRMPAHLGLRTALESESANEAVAKLESAGMAASAHMLIADASGEAIGLEFTCSTFAKLRKNDLGTIVHSNHLILDHGGVVGIFSINDSPKRLERMTALTEKLRSKSPGWREFGALFEDQSGFPISICRAQEGVSVTATLFNIVMDLRARRATVKLGKPNAVEEEIELSFE